MVKLVKWAAFAVACVLAIYMFIPVGLDVDEVANAYTSTLSYATSDGMVYGLLDVIDGGDPVIRRAADGLSEMCAYLWVNEVDKPVSYVKTSTFPTRGGNTASHKDHYLTSQEATYHSGTDFTPAAPYSNQDKVYQVALWDGVLFKSYYSEGYGHCIVIDHGNGLYTRYAHMAYGNAASKGGIQPQWAGSRTDSSLLYTADDIGTQIYAGDKLGIIGTTGSSTGPHAHIELIFTNDWETGRKYYAGIDNVLHGTSVADLSWYGFDRINDAWDIKDGDIKDLEDLQR